MEELNYKPAPAVKTQAGRKTGFVGVMVPSLEHPFFARINAAVSNTSCPGIITNVSYAIPSTL